MTAKPALSAFRLDKRGFTYLLVTSFFIVVLLTAFFTTSRYSYQDQESLQQIRIRAMNDFMKNLKIDIHRATYISSFRAMLALEDHVTSTGQYLSDVNSSFRETFFYGTINGTESAIMTNSTFEDYLQKVRLLALYIGINLDMNVTNIRMTQSSPWAIDIYMLINITASDSKNTSAWHINQEFMTNAPIDNMRDPLYSKNSFNRVPNTIRKLNNDTLVDGTDVTNLVTHIEGSYYLESDEAPTFLMRFEGKTDSDPNGIESIVDIRALSDQEIPIYEDRVKIDYIYFNDMSTTDKVCNVSGIPPADYFVISLDRIYMYQVDNLSFYNSTDCP